MLYQYMLYSNSKDNLSYPVQLATGADHANPTPAQRRHENRRRSRRPAAALRLLQS